MVTSKESNFLNHNAKSEKLATICQGLDAGSHKKQKPLGERSKAVRRQKLMVFLGNMGVLGAGMTVALPAVTLGQLTDTSLEFNLSGEEASWFSAVHSVGCPFGGLFVGYIMDRYGRKATIFLTNIVGLLGWILLAACTVYQDHQLVYAQMLVGRFLSGILFGSSVSPVGVYSAEISLPRIRGRLILGTSISIAAGILSMYVLGYFIRNDWQLISIICCAFQIISTLCVLPMPESPSWLLQKGQVEKARKALRYFRGFNTNDHSSCEEFELELSQIKKNADLSRSTAQNESFIKTLRTPEVYKPILLMMGLFVFQQFTGVVVIVVFAVQITESTGVKTDPFLCAVMVGVARMITTFFMSTIFEKWGRKVAGIVSAVGMTTCMLLLATSSGWWSPLNQLVPILPIVCIVLHIIFSTMGLLTLPFFMISEVFPQRVRGPASGVTTCFGFILSFFVIKLYPAMNSSWGTANVFGFYGSMSLLAVAFIYFWIPETRGRTLQEIEEYFRKGRISSLNTKQEEEMVEMMPKPKDALTA